ncbi:MAG: VWA domain-containing protein [Methanothrix sp.]|nr:VWA domain-containing protein [Methanothrix sp.]
MNTSFSQSIIIILFCILALAPASASVSVTFDQSITDPQIWPEVSGKSPDTTKTSIAVEGRGEPCSIPTRVVLAIDSSGSMNTSDPNRERVDAAIQFVKEILQDPENKVGLVIWDTQALTIPLTNNSNVVLPSIKATDAAGGTDLDLAMRSSIGLFPERDISSMTSDFIVLLSDGMGKYTPSGNPGSLTDLAESRGIKVFTIALGNQSDMINLTEIAKVTGGEAYFSPDANAIKSIYKEIGSNIEDFLADNVTVTYALPKILKRVRSAPEPDSITESGDLVFLTWNIGSIVAGKPWNAELTLASSDPGKFPLGINPYSKVSYTGCDGVDSFAELPQDTLTVNADRPFILAGYGEGGNAYDNKTRVLLTKEVIPNQNKPCPDCPNIHFKVETPPVPCNLEILLAIDKSGSMREKDESGDFNYVLMKREIDSLLASLPPGTKVAIVSWDDDAPLNAHDSATSSAGFVTLPAGLGSLTSTTGNYDLSTCLETDQTVYSSAIERINSVLSSAPLSLTARSNTVRLVIYITSWSEFKPERNLGDLNRTLQSLIGGLPVECRDKIYTFYLGPAPAIPPYRQAQLNALRLIASSTGGSGPQWLNLGNLKKVIEQEEDACAERPWISDMMLTDTLYPYLNVINTYPKAITTNNADGTTTLVWNVGNMGRGKTWEATVETAFDMTLPVDLTSARTQVGFNAAAGTPVSTLNYKWPGFFCCSGRADSYQIPVPEGKIRLSCGVPCEIQAATSVGVASPVVNETSKVPQGTKSSQESKETPGFESALGLVTTLALAYLKRR